MILQRPIPITFDDISGYNVAQEYQVWDVNTAYAKGDRVITSACGCKVFESAINSNTTNPEIATASEWFQVEISNWAAQFDDMSNTQTVSDDLIEYTITSSELVTGLSFINIEAASLQVIVNDPVAGEIFNQTYDLLQHKVFDYRDWFLQKPTLIKRIDIDNIEPTIGGSTTIRFSNPGSQVKIGQVARGYRHVIGTCEWGGIQPRIFTYSDINEDIFGNIEITQRLKKRDVTFQVQIPTDYLDEVIDLVEQYQDKPALFIGTGDYQGSFVYGLVEDFNPTYANVIDSPYSLKIKGYA